MYSEIWGIFIIRYKFSVIERLSWGPQRKPSLRLFAVGRNGVPKESSAFAWGERR